MGDNGELTLVLVLLVVFNHFGGATRILAGTGVGFVLGLLVGLGVVRVLFPSAILKARYLLQSTAHFTELCLDPLTSALVLGLGLAAF